MTFADSIAAFGHLWLIEGAILLVLLTAMILNWKRVVGFITSNMIAVALTIWCIGLSVYMLGFSYEGTGRSFPALLFRSMQAALGMFLSENELIEVSEHYKESPLYMTVFAATHISAVFVSAILIFTTIGHRMKSSFSILRESIRCRRQDRSTYVFFGINAPSVSLAKDVRKEYTDARIIFLHSPGEHSMGEKLEVTELIESSSVNHHSAADLSQVEAIESALLVYISGEEGGSNKYKRLRRILESASELHFFFLTADDRLNLSLAEMTAEGKQFNIQPSQTVNIHVLSQDSSKRRAVEENTIINDSSNANIKWSFVDLSQLSVASLKHDTEHHPVSTYPDDAIVRGRIHGDFNSWILGLGSTGSEMFRFLYEFSSFVGEDGKPIDKHISVFDKRLEHGLGNLFRPCPEILSSGCVEPVELTVGSVAFWERLRAEADSLNCVCICLGNDELDLKLTREIYRHLLQYRSSKALKTKIFVRIYTPEYEDIMHTLADQYNGCAEDNTLKVVPFGGLSELFNTKIMLKEDVIKAFHAFNYRFDMIRGRNEGCTSEQCWDIDFDINKYTGKYENPTIAMDELARRTEQCQSETYHIGTLVRLAGIDRGDRELLLRLTEATRNRSVDRPGYIGVDSSTTELLDVLAMNAHLRQKALHELQGFRPARESEIKKDLNEAVRQKLTDYVLPWEECSDKVKNVSYAIVNTSFAIASDYVRNQ